MSDTNNKMTNNKMSVSSSLLGRDLSIIKSILNIENLYGNMVFEFVSDSRVSDVYITRDEGEDHYYAILKKNKSTVSIKPTLNPLTLRALLKHISSLDFTATNNQIVNDENILENIYSFCINGTKPIMHIKSKECHKCYEIETQPENCVDCELFHILLDLKKDLLLSTSSVNSVLLSKIIRQKKSNFKITFEDQYNPSEFNNQSSLFEFKWKLGFILKGRLFKKEYRKPDYSFKQVTWPDYGHLPHKPQFIQLSSLLAKGNLTFDALIDLTGFDEKVINQFINAGCLSRHLLVLSNRSDNNVVVKHKKSRFISALKSFFSKSG